MLLPSTEPTSTAEVFRFIGEQDNSLSSLVAALTVTRKSQDVAKTGQLGALSRFGALV
jgi:hypothetical protein